MKKRGVITFVFDDGYQKVYENALPALNKYGIPGVFALPIDGQKLAKTEQRAIRPWHEWLPVKQAGHEIASHTVTHPNLTKISDKQLEEELTAAADKLEASTIVYPGGAVNNHVAEIASHTYSAGRTVRYGFETIPPKEPMLLKSYNFSRNNFSVWKANLLAVWAYLTNSWLIETYHMVDGDDEHMVHTVKTEDLDKHLRFVSRLPIATKTIQQVVS